MNATTLIAEARAAGLILHLIGEDRLKCKGMHPIQPDLLKRLQEARADVIAALREEGHRGHRGHKVDEPQRWRDAFEERAAIREHDGGLSRAEAEAAALLDMATRWRSENPMPASGRDACCYCDKPAPCTSILAGAPGEHAWIHRECLEPMNRSRQEEALAAVRALLGFDIGAGQCKR
jgi:hypothetical protein